MIDTDTDSGDPLWYNGDFNVDDPNASGLINMRDAMEGQASVYDNFVVPAGTVWNINTVFSNNLITDFNETGLAFNLTGADFSIRSGVSAGNGGTVVASGTDLPATMTPTGRSLGGVYDENTVAITGLNLYLAPGMYWLTVTPVDDNPDDQGLSYLSTTTGANAVGLPAGNDGNSYFDSTDFGVTFGPAGDNLYGDPVDFSEGVMGTGATAVPPVAGDDSYSVMHDTTLTVPAASGVLANDTDTNGLSLSAALVTQANHGTVTLNPDGSFTYVPDAGYYGTDSFQYQASDGASTSNTATVTLNVQGSVNGQVWLDNNGDGSLDDGEMGFSGISVNLDSPTGQVLMTTTTDASGNYQFVVNPSLGSQFEIQAVLPDGDEATTEGADSDIDANGYSPVFALAPGGAANVQAGIRSTVVTTTQDDANGPIQNQVTLRDAINTVNKGLSQRVTFAAGVNGTISLQAALPALSKNITITGVGNTITIQGNPTLLNLYRIFTINPDITAEIDGVTITGGVDSSVAGGGGICNYGNLTLINDVIQDNTEIQGPGGGIANLYSASLSLTNDDIQFNNAPQGGGIANFGQLISAGGFSTAIIANNATAGKGGGIYNLGDTHLQDSVQISGNTATDVGGGVYNGNTDNFTMDGGYLSNNDASKGGGLYNGGGTVTLDSGLMVQMNQANQGGGLYLAAQSTTTLNTITIQNNILVGNGPLGRGIYLQNDPPLTETNVTDPDDPTGPFKGT